MGCVFHGPVGEIVLAVGVLSRASGGDNDGLTMGVPLTGTVPVREDGPAVEGGFELRLHASSKLTSTSMPNICLLPKRMQTQLRNARFDG